MTINVHNNVSNAVTYMRRTSSPSKKQPIGDRKTKDISGVYAFPWFICLHTTPLPSSFHPPLSISCPVSSVRRPSECVSSAKRWSFQQSESSISPAVQSNLIAHRDTPSRRSCCSQWHYGAHMGTVHKVVCWTLRWQHQSDLRLRHSLLWVHN